MLYANRDTFVACLDISVVYSNSCLRLLPVPQEDSSMSDPPEIRPRRRVRVAYEDGSCPGRKGARNTTENIGWITSRPQHPWLIWVDVVAAIWHTTHGLLRSSKLEVRAHENDIKGCKYHPLGDELLLTVSPQKA